ncbi:DUF294 nucleotidyltransferase-like domain-containing protein [Granulosicoccus antarcticus]|uniref:Arabinose 5-phosphate isomerase KdsD n=1 Tax=Granulosicoccus antarcticus IMCC3135 TaxID=1192854 RepID=A0A2Z2NWC0_9GAMM|nr:DUF294 nucleotidyltransferase-like domain-containing protein [Granulosicoccus antarcticus]ASJ73120.1 Arabinose 5-phosphate isomerase KdsD [Granulosicoccus antarcticus IMCC3135]
MDIEQLEIRDFVGAQRPFDQLPDEALVAAVTEMSVRYVRRETEVLALEDGEPALSLVRSGAVELRGESGELLARFGEGDLLGYRASAHELAPTDHHIALEDSLLYRLPASIVDKLCNEHSQLAWYLAPTGAGRLRDAVHHHDDANDSPLNLTDTRLGELLGRQPVHLPPTASIKLAAERMSQENVSSMLIVEDEALFGILTDRDLRLRVIAAGIDYQSPVSEVMTLAPITADIETIAYDALLTMARNRIHHLPVLDGSRVAGVVTSSDFIERHSTSSIYLAADIHRQNTVETLVAIARRLPVLVQNLAAAGASAERTQRVVTGLADTFTIRLLELAELELGPPPVDYAWVVAGSQARGEFTIASDQDNALILDDAFDPARDDAYFEAMACFVCDGLNQCGQSYCPGDVMASNPEWRQSLSNWQARFTNWIDNPDPTALMHGCTFFDLRHVYGDAALTATLRSSMLERTRGNSIFLSHLAGNALSRHPPLGFFRNFVLSGGRDDAGVLDLKHAGVVPIVDLARVYTLAAGMDVVNTRERLEAAGATDELSESGARDLCDALTFLLDTRYRHQARQLDAGIETDNLVAPDSLSRFERGHLKDAFSIVRTMQRALAQRSGH